MTRSRVVVRKATKRVSVQFTVPEILAWVVNLQLAHMTRDEKRAVKRVGSLMLAAADGAAPYVLTTAVMSLAQCVAEAVREEYERTLPTRRARRKP